MNARLFYSFLYDAILKQSRKLNELPEPFTTALRGPVIKRNNKKKEKKKKVKKGAAEKLLELLETLWPKGGAASPACGTNLNEVIHQVMMGIPDNSWPICATVRLVQLRKKYRCSS